MASPLPTSRTTAVPGPDPGAIAGLISALESARDQRGAVVDAALVPEECGNVRRGEVPFELDAGLVSVCREQGPLRAALAQIATRLVRQRAWERLGFARLSDYAAECLGLSSRSVQDLAHVGQALRFRPALESALVSGMLGWTKARLLARLDREEDLEAWIDYARRASAQDLAGAVRAVDRGSVEAGAVDESEARSARFEVRCTPEVRRKWHGVRSVARRAAGRMLHPAEAAELVAAEVLSALPVDEAPGAGPCEEEGFSWARATAPAVDGETPERRGPDGELLPPWPRGGAAVKRRSKPKAASSRPSYPASLRSLLEGLDEADAFSLDERLQRALSLERRLEARIGPLLAAAWPGFVYRAAGYTSREAWVRDRLGMDPTRARTLVRLERVAGENEAFARAYRSGGLSWVRASVVAPLVRANPLGWFVGDWVSWAQRVTVRRLRDEVDEALTLAETDPGAFHRTGGLPAEAHREIGARERAPGGEPVEVGRGGVVARGGRGDDDEGREREIGAPERAPVWDRDEAPPGHRHPEPLKRAPHETCWATFTGPPDIVQLFKAVLCTVRRHLERQHGRLPTEGEALDAMIDHCFEAWGARDEKVAARHEVFARDGWRCAVPGCTSMDNLHDHHIRFRSAQGSDELANRVAMCAFHHLRGVHQGTLRCIGRAPDGLRWELGVRPRVTPRLAYRSGDIRIPLPARPAA